MMVNQIVVDLRGKAKIRVNQMTRKPTTFINVLVNYYYLFLMVYIQCGAKVKGIHLDREF